MRRIKIIYWINKIKNKKNKYVNSFNKMVLVNLEKSVINPIIKILKRCVGIINQIIVNMGTSVNNSTIRLIYL